MEVFQRRTNQRSSSVFWYSILLRWTTRTFIHNFFIQCCIYPIPRWNTCHMRSHSARPCLSLALTLSCVSALAQPTNPQDPTNWEILTPLYDGFDQFQRSERVTVNNNTFLVTATYKRDWSTCRWTRNDQPIPGDLPTPFWRQVGDPETLTGISAGTVTVRMKWKHLGTYPVPETVLGIIQTSAFAQTPDNINGSTYVDCGLPNTSPEIDTSHGYRKSENKRQIQALTIDQQTGIAYACISKEAWASYSLPAYAPTAYVDCNAKDTWLSVACRSADIILNGGQFKPVNMPYPIERSILDVTNPDHDNFVTLRTLTVSHPAAIRGGSTPVYTSASNSDTYVIGSPTYESGNSMNTGQRLRFAGYASTENIDEESYQWQSDVWQSYSSTFCSKSHSHFLCDTSFKIEPIEPFADANLITHHSQGVKRWTTYSPANDSNHTISLSYHWPATSALNSFDYTSTRTVIAIQPRLTIAETAAIDNPTTKKIPVFFPQYNQWWVPDGLDHRTSTATSDIPTYDREAAEFWAGHVADAAGLWDSNMSKGVTAVAIAVGIYAHFDSAGVKDLGTIDRDTYDSDFTWWTLDNQTTETKPATAFGGGLKYTWKWKVFERPVVRKQAYVYNVYDLNGFRGRYTDVFNQELELKGNLLFEFFKNSPGGPGGGGNGTPGGLE